ncbi:MAG: NIL domain-containing protein [Candidatus Omnitrophota bacterium]|nr:NIL domain-containing protein [Candidatus Omnitrophota bacterium]
MSIKKKGVEMAKQMIHYFFPQKLVKKPVIYTMAKKFDVIPNIRRAKITETGGEVTLELSGKKENLEKARKYLERAGVTIEPVTGDVVE